MFLNLIPDHLSAHRMFPLAADRTVVECDWLFDPEVAAARDVSASAELFHRVNEQDFEARERRQPSMSSLATRPAACWSPPSTTWLTSTSGCGKWLVRVLILSRSDKRGASITNYG